MGGIERTSNRKINPYAAIGAAAGLGGLGLGAYKLYKAYDKYKFIKEASKAMANNPSLDILQMIPL